MCLGYGQTFLSCGCHLQLLSRLLQFSGLDSSSQNERLDWHPLRARTCEMLVFWAQGKALQKRLGQQPTGTPKQRRARFLGKSCLTLGAQGLTRTLPSTYYFPREDAG